MTLLTSIHNELLKTKRTSSIYLTILVSLMVPLILFLEQLEGGDYDADSDLWNMHFIEGFQALNFLILPLFIILLTTLMPQVEYRNNTWKQVLASPQPLLQVLLSKFANLHLMILLFFLLFNLCMVLSALGISMVNPTANFYHHAIDWGKLAMVNANTYIFIVPISAIQFWLGLRFKNFIIPIAVGLFLYIAGGIILFELQVPHAEKFPYTFSIYTMIPKNESIASTLYWYSPGYTLFFLGWSYRDLKTGNIKA